MKKTIEILLYITIVILSLFSCSSKKELSTQLPYKTQSIYFQKWIGGQELTGGGTNFYIQFQSPLPQNVSLVKVYFQDKEASFNQESETTFIARFTWKPNNKDLIMDGESSNEYGNKAPEITKPRFILQPTEAMLEFKVNNKIQQYKIVDIKEKELIAYPSAPPRN